MKVVTYVSALFCLIVIIGCGNPESSFTKIEKKPDKRSYQEFINDYPESDLVKLARRRIDDIDTWESINTDKKIEKYKSYKEKFPEGLFSKDADLRINEIMAYDQAKNIDMIKAYNDFLSKHSKGLFANDCKSRIEDLSKAAEEYKKLNLGDDVSTLKNFISRFSGTGYAKLIYEQLFQKEITKAEKKILSLIEYENVPNNIKALESFIAENKGNTIAYTALEYYDEIITSVIKNIGAYDRFSISNILPEDSKNVCILDLNDGLSRSNNTDSVDKPSGGVKVKGKINDGLSNNDNVDFLNECSGGLNFSGLVWCLEKSQSSASFITKGTGCLTIEDPNANKKNFVTSIAVKQKNNGEFILFTICPKDRIVAKVMGDSEVYIPNGCGSIFRFFGKVENFFEGYSFLSENKYSPLSFFLHEKYGLTYISGYGSVADKNGKVLFRHEKGI